MGILVRVEVRGGVAEATVVPEGVTVDIVDWDDINASQVCDVSELRVLPEGRGMSHAQADRVLESRWFSVESLPEDPGREIIMASNRCIHGGTDPQERGIDFRSSRVEPVDACMKQWSTNKGFYIFDETAN